MRERLIRAPWWGQALVYGVPFAASQALFGHPIGAVAVSGMFFGLPMGFWSARFNRRFLRTRGDLTSDQRRDLARALRRGPAPLDPEVRAAAIRVNALLVRRQRYLLWWALPAYGALIIGSVSLAVTENRAWALAALFFLALTVSTVVVRRRAQQRQRILAG